MEVRRVLVVTFLLIFAVVLEASSQVRGLDQPLTLTARDHLTLHLNVLAAQLTSGAYVIGDMGSFDVPVEIGLTRDGLIEARVHAGFAKAMHTATEEDVEHAFTFLSTAIERMLTKHFPFLEFNLMSDMVGYWYGTPTPVHDWTWREGRLFAAP